MSSILYFWIYGDGASLVPIPFLHGKLKHLAHRRRAADVASGDADLAEDEAEGGDGERFGDEADEDEGAVAAEEGEVVVYGEIVGVCEELGYLCDGGGAVGLTDGTDEQIQRPLVSANTFPDIRSRRNILLRIQLDRILPLIIPSRNRRHLGPILLAIITPKCPNPPIPMIPTRLAVVPAPYCIKGENVVTPPQNMDAAAAGSI